MQMQQFSLLLDMCRIHCREVETVPVDEFATIEDVTIVRGVACSFEQSQLRKLVCDCTQLCVYFQRFKKPGGVKSIELCPGKNLYSALLP